MLTPAARLGLLAALLLAASAAAQDPAPSASSAPGPFRCFVVSDQRYAPKANPPKRPEDRDPRDRTGKMHSFVLEQSLNPVVLVLSREAPTPDSVAARLTKLLNADLSAKANRGTSLSAFTVFCTLENEFPADEQRTADGAFLRDDALRQVQELATQLAAPKVPIGLAARTSPQTAAWGLGAEDDVVVTVYNRLAVVKRAKFKANEATDAQLGEIVAAAREAGKK